MVLQMSLTARGKMSRNYLVVTKPAKKTSSALNPLVIVVELDLLIDPAEKAIA